MRVLFLCTGNSARSQMAEGLLRDLSKGVVESLSAGTAPRGLHPLAVEVMSEIGIDITSQSSKHLDSLVGQPFDYVIAVCDRVQDTCPNWPEAKEHIRWSFEDPALVVDPKRARLAFTLARNQIAQRIHLFLLAHGVGSKRAVEK